MYPGRSIWVWGVLALGAGTFLLSALQWWNKSTIRTESGVSMRSILIDESKSDGLFVFGRSTTKKSASYAWTDGIILKSRGIEGDRRWKRNTRLDSRNDGSMIEKNTETSVIYEEQRVSPSISVDDRKIKGDGLSRQNFHVNEGSVLDDSSEQDQHPVIIRTDTHLNIEAQVLTENNPGRLNERERQRNKKDNDRTTIDIVTSPKLRNDRFEEDIVVKTGSRSKSKVEDRQGSRIDVVNRNMQTPRSREASINVDNYLRSSTLMLRHTQNSQSTNNQYVPKLAASTLKSDDRKGILEIDEKNARLNDLHESFDSHILRTTTVMEIEEEITPAFSRPLIIDRDIERPNEAEETSRSSSGKPAAILGSLERNAAEGDARRFAGGMQEDQLLFFHEDRERVQSSAMSSTEAIQDRKNLLGERDRGDPARKRRETSHDWFTRTSNQSNFRRHDNGVRHKEVFKKSIINNNEQNDEDNNNNKYNDPETDIPVHKDDRLQNILSKDLNSSGDQLQNKNSDEKLWDDTNAFQFLDSIIPPDNKRRKVTRGEESKDLMVTRNFVWTSQNQEIGNRALIPIHRPTFSQDNWKTSHNTLSKKRIRSIDRPKDARGKTGDTEVATIRKMDQRETVNGDRRNRYANYYTTRSVTPMAYVHIQPAYPVAPPTKRKCVRCMVVYKPCSSQPRPPPKIILPSYRYHEPANKWRGLKYDGYLLASIRASTFDLRREEELEDHGCGSLTEHRTKFRAVQTATQ
ncbi:hypothetical protein ALC62_14014 [Cyphomyrmex costatus]|uniref:Uncharacterized protein n=1 Tax=Cyphomyrmex costatus TaxID=456900 RepID=A0A151I955_9HYME|nr:hypothetical protein ALC62_14014 [Cyphomyrmex costatus]